MKIIVGRPVLFLRSHPCSYRAADQVRRGSFNNLGPILIEAPLEAAFSLTAVGIIVLTHVSPVSRIKPLPKDLEIILACHEALGGMVYPPQPRSSHP